MNDFIEVTSSDATGNTHSRLRRRGLIAGAAAFVAAIVAKEALAPERVSATDGTALIVGANNTSVGQTVLTATTGVGNAPFRVLNNYGASTPPDNEADGIQAFVTGTNNSAMLGRNDDLNAVGVFGIATNGTGAAGQSTGGSAVSGSSSSGAGGYFTAGTGYGALGLSSTNYGLIGQSGSNSGVFGFSQGTGVTGSSSGGPQSPAPFGVVGTVFNAPGFALFGIATVANTVGFAAGASTVGAIAGQFSGNVNFYASTSGNTVIGNTVTLNGTNLIVANGGTKNAAMQLPDGSYGLLHCVEAPKAYFEDFGEGTVTGGKAEIKIDPNFAAVVDASEMHVFLTETGGHSGLHVTSKGASSFSVSASDTLAQAAGKTLGSVSSTFSYRVVALRKDVKNERFTRFVLPKEIKVPAPKITAPKIPAATPRHADGPIKH